MLFATSYLVLTFSQLEELVPLANQTRREVPIIIFAKLLAPTYTKQKSFEGSFVLMGNIN